MCHHVLWITVILEKQPIRLDIQVDHVIMQCNEEPLNCEFVNHVRVLSLDSIAHVTRLL